MSLITSFIGQTGAVAEINDIIRARSLAIAEKRNFKFRPLLVTGLTGLGKTELSKAIAKAMDDMNHASLPIKAGWGEAGKLAEEIASFDDTKLAFSPAPYVISIDEAHAQTTLGDLLKVWFDDNGNEQIVSRNKTNYYYNPFFHWPMFLTNRKLDAAIMGRCYKIQLVPYNKGEKIRLIQRFGNDGGVTFNDEALEIIESRVKPQAREIKDIVYPFTLFPGKVNGKQAMDKLLAKGFYPMGLRKTDLAILQTTAKLRVAKANVLKRAAQDDKKRDTEDTIDWLIAMQLMIDVRGGYSVTDNGAKYLAEIIAKQKAAKAAKAK